MEKWYWLEYHVINSTHTLSNCYHLRTPPAMSAKITKSWNHIPYREWLNSWQEDCTLHGPFEFSSTINGSKLRDQINIVGWDILILAKCWYKCEPPWYKWTGKKQSSE
jgi:hypothetical protein